MSANWDFRSILDVYPDRSSFTCVGVTQKGARCGQRMFSGSDLSCASRLLDEMSTLRKLSSSYKYLEELAELTLCPRWHRKPGYSQVRSVSRRWQNKIAKIEREQEKTAMVKSDALADMTKNIDNMIKRLEEIHNKVCSQFRSLLQTLIALPSALYCQPPESPRTRRDLRRDELVISTKWLFDHGYDSGKSVTSCSAIAAGITVRSTKVL
jgi:hypothetical protein